MNLRRNLMLAATALTLFTTATAEVTIPVFTGATYYDGYLAARIPESAPDEGYTRLYTYLNTVKLSDEQLDLIGEELTIKVVGEVACDEYDRIGSVKLALVPKGECYSVKYDETDPVRIELARFITPFMSPLKDPKEVPYEWWADNLSLILRDKSLRDNYDFWIELEMFGVPYSAQQKYEICKGCNHVWTGNLYFVTSDTPAPLIDHHSVTRIVTPTIEFRGDFGMCNYRQNGTDELGKTIKTYRFSTDKDMSDAQIVLIMSNHGANTGGEEYKRRFHYIYFDDKPLTTFKPGRQTCEPFRQYNTQPNGIYGMRPKSDAAWQAFSNWCPGDKIDTRILHLGEVKAGDHSVCISVPDARFVDSQGVFPVGLYFQGVTEGSLPDEAEETALAPISAKESITATVTGGVIRVSAPRNIVLIELFDIAGRGVTASLPGSPDAEISTSGIVSGSYILTVTLDNAGTETFKISL